MIGSRTIKFFSVIHLDDNISLLPSIGARISGYYFAGFAVVGVLSVSAVLCRTSASVLPAPDVGSQPGAPTDSGNTSTRSTAWKYKHQLMKTKSSFHPNSLMHFLFS